MKPSILNQKSTLMMQVEQAVFASSNHGKIKGYHLIGYSAGLDRQTRDTLTRWAPTKLLSDAPEDWIISSFPVADDIFAVARTLVGGPEYSLRGGTQVVTRFLVLSGSQYEAYEFDPLAVAANALAMGDLRLPQEIGCETLPHVTMPDSPICNSNASGMDQELSNQTIDDVLNLLENQRRVAVVGSANPIVAATELIAHMSEDLRKGLSITTGLMSSVRRPFKVHFFASQKCFQSHGGDTNQLVCVENRP